MTEREQYKRMFSVIRPSPDFSLEVTEMKTGRKSVRALVAVCIAILLVIGSVTVAYAADLGGFRQMVQVWIKGERQVIEIEQVGEGHFQWTDENGDTQRGGGVIQQDNGDVLPLTIDEWAQQMSDFGFAEKADDGRVWFYYKDYKEDITEQVANDGIAKIKLEEDGKPLYITVKDNHGGGYAVHIDTDGFWEDFTIYENFTD
ncbi:MAG: hypothetical protein J1E06_00480 [Acutalibacter sp.]|nr:hypothetical protein [Acutalibacter sp.]